MVIAFIRRHIKRLDPKQIFSTREMLIYGSRSAVDSALSRLVQSGFITRLARGVFVRQAPKVPNLEGIAIAKAMAFKVQLKLLPEYVLKRLGIPLEGFAATYGRIGHSGSFGTISGRVSFRAFGPRKTNLLTTTVGQAIFALWLLGNKLCCEKDVDRVTLNFGRAERSELWRLGTVMPQWLSELCEGYVESRRRCVI